MLYPFNIKQVDSLQEMPFRLQPIRIIVVLKNGICLLIPN